MDIAHYLPYLVNRAGQQFVTAFTPSLAAEGQDIQSWRVLFVLNQRGAMKVGELSRLTSINVSTLSRLLDRMEKKGLLKRTPDPADARSIGLELTLEGREVFERLRPAAEALEARALQVMSEEEGAELRRLLNKLHGGMSGVAKIGNDMAARKTLMISGRFCGPSTSGHGGYTAGQLARYIDGPAEVTLRRPIPMDRSLGLVTEGDSIRLMDGDDEVAVAHPAEFSMDPIAAPTLEEAEQAEQSFLAEEDHLYPHCFVCGPQREAGDGLRVFAGIIPGRRYACARWFPDAGLAREDGRIDDPFVWALLDCPAYFGMDLGKTFVLTGRMAVKILDRPWAEEPYIVAGWKTGQDGRKHFAGSAIFDTRGKAMAVSTSTWIEPRMS